MAYIILSGECVLELRQSLTRDPLLRESCSSRPSHISVLCVRVCECLVCVHAEISFFASSKSMANKKVLNLERPRCTVTLRRIYRALSNAVNDRSLWRFSTEKRPSIYRSACFLARSVISCSETAQFGLPVLCFQAVMLYPLSRSSSTCGCSWLIRCKALSLCALPSWCQSRG